MPRRSVKLKRRRMQEQAQAQAVQDAEHQPYGPCSWPGCTKHVRYPSVLCVYHTQKYEQRGVPRG